MVSVLGISLGGEEGERGSECDIKQLLEKLHTLDSDVELLLLKISIAQEARWRKHAVESTACACLYMFKNERLKYDRINLDVLNIDTTVCDSLGLDEDICVDGVQHKFTDKLLCDGDGSLVGHTEIREIIQESGRVEQT